MTLTAASTPAASPDVDPPPDQVDATKAAASDRSTPAAQPDSPGLPRDVRVGPAVALSLGLAALLLLGFFAFLAGFSRLSEARAQHELRTTFRHELAQAIAPVGPTAEGKPVAVLRVPALGGSDLVVVEGTTSRDLMSGPGHLPATVLPGQAGVSTVLGRRSTFGGPFRSLLALNVGDEITAITGQGISRYRVSSFGDSTRPAPANSANRLLLETAGPGSSPNTFVMVSADLVSRAQPSPGGLPGVAREQEPLARDTAQSLVPLTGWAQVLLLCAIVGTLLAVRAPKRARWPAALCLTPVVLAVVWNVYENAAGLLPNLL